MNVNWNSQESHVFVNERSFLSALPSDWEGFKEYPGHIWIATSGTSAANASFIKWVALSKKAFLTSASAVNRHLNCNSTDIWLNSLPLFHVGGLSIYARASLSRAKVEPLSHSKWCPLQFLQKTQEVKATLTSLVPAQVFDLVKLGLRSPPSLRGILVGGGILPDHIYEAAKKLHWNLLPTYGMTECCSSVATSHLGSPELHILPHVECSLSSEGLLQIKGESLLTGYLEIDQQQFSWRDPKKEGVFTSEDLCFIEGEILRILRFAGRIHDWIKIGGENVNLFHLDSHFQKLKMIECDAVLFAEENERLGKSIAVAVQKEDATMLQPIIDQFNLSVMPYEKIRNIHLVDAIPRNALGKVMKGQLMSAALLK